MKKQTITLTRALPLIALFLGLWISAGTARAATDVWLVAQPYDLLMPDGITVPMWGYGLADPGFANIQPPTAPGPFLTVTSAPLTVHLRNTLAVPVSIMIPTLPVEMDPVKFTDPTGRARIRSFTHETAPGADGTYVFSTLREGTFIYTSGTHIQVQQQMGLYGGLKVELVPGQAYPGVPYDVESVFIFSEIDPDLHFTVTNGIYGTPDYPSTLEYAPSYHLLNGSVYTSAVTPTISGGAGQTVLVRFLNAGLRPKVPQVLGGYLELVAEDAFPYPYSQAQYGASLAPGKTLDALADFAVAGSLPLLDRIGYAPVRPIRDLNLDGLYNNEDLVIMASFLAGSVTPGTPPFNSIAAAADLDNNGLTNAADLSRMLRELAGWFPY